MKHRDYIILKKISSEIRIMNTIISEIDYDSFYRNELVKRAICMTVINIGELVKSITDDTRNKYPIIPWKSASGFRDIAAHKYETLRMEDVYKTVTEDFPEMLTQLEKIIQTETDEQY